MLIHALGDVGSGKTLWLTAMALEASQNGYQVYANYHIKIPNFTFIDNPAMLNDLPFGCLVLLDEAYNFIESRRSPADINLYMSYILFQCRKIGIDIIMSDQLEITIDTRYRSMTTWYILCELGRRGFEYTFIKRATLKAQKPKTFILPFRAAESLYPLYDTYERINPIDNDLLIRIATDKSQFMEEIDTIVDDLLSKAPASAYTQGIVSQICIERNFPRSYVKLIYNNLKARAIPR